MQNFFTSIRVKPLRSCDFTSKNYSLKKSLLHDERRYNETHIDKEKSSNNIIIGTLNYDEIIEKINKMKDEYPLANKKTTIDVANYIFTVKKEFFDNDEKKQIFLKQAEEFLKKECGENSILSVVGHDDEDGFHVHAYTIPLHNTIFKNRYGTTEKITINYRGKYSNSQEEINKFRSEKHTELSKTGQLQTRWFEHINNIFPELQRGISNTGKTNVKPKEFREMIEKEMPKLKEEFEKIEQEKEEIMKETKEKIGIYNVLKEHIKTKEEVLTDINIELYQKKRELSELEKEELKGYREINIYDVAKLFGKQSFPDKVNFDGKTKYIKNALDYLMYVEKISENDYFSFTGAFDFLREKFGTERLLNTVIQMTENVNEKEKFTGNFSISHKIKAKLIKQQFDVLQNPMVRITARKKVYEKTVENGKEKLKFTGEERVFLPGKYKFQNDNGEEVKGERFFNRKQVIEMIDELTKLNTEGFDIYLTPIEYQNVNGKLPIFIDDVIGDDNLELLKNYIGEPNYVQQTSIKFDKNTQENKPNYQVIYLVDNLIDYENRITGNKKDREFYHKIFQDINRKFGDFQISGLRHAIRIAGFASKKPGRNNFFTKPISLNTNAENKILELMKEFFEKENVKIRPVLKEKIEQKIEENNEKKQNNLKL